MAVKTPDSIRRESLGSVILLIATFNSNDIDDTDTWASGLGGNVVGHWFQATDAPSTTTNAYSVAVSESAGTFTFNTEEDNRQGLLYVLATI